MLWLTQRDFLEGKTVQQMVSEALSELLNPTRNVDIAQVPCCATLQVQPSMLLNTTRPSLNTYYHLSQGACSDIYALALHEGC